MRFTATCIWPALLFSLLTSGKAAAQAAPGINLLPRSPSQPITLPNLSMPHTYRLNQDGWLVPPQVLPAARDPLAEVREKNGEKSPEYLEAGLQLVIDAVDSRRVEEAQKLYDELEPRALAMLKEAGKAATTEDRYIRLNNQLYRCRENFFYARGQMADYVKTAVEHLKVLREAGSEEARVAEVTTITILSHQLVELKRVAECRPWLKRAAEIINEVTLPANDLHIAMLISLTRDASTLELKQEARLFGEAAIKAAESLPTGTGREKLASSINVARVYMEQDRLLEAETVLAKIRAEIEKTEPIDASSLALVINDIGLVNQRIYDFQGDKDRLEKAEKLFDESYKIAKQAGDNSLEAERGYCSRLSNLALIKVRKGKVAESTDLLKQAAETAEKRLGPKDQQTIDILCSYAIALGSFGRVNEAVEIHRDVLKRSKEVFGDIHPRTGDAQHLLGSVLIKLGQYNEAEKCYEHSAGIRERTHGPDHAETAKAYFNLGLIREAKSDFAGASAYYGHVLKIDIKAHGQDSSTVAHDMAALARTLTQEGKFDEAVSRLNQHIAFVEKEFGKDNLVLGISLLALATIEEKRENYQNAESLFKRVIDIRISNLGPEHHDVAAARAHYGLFLVSRNKLTQAAGQIRRAAVLFARHNQREGASGADMRACIDIYGSILARLQYDRQTIQKHMQNLESGIDPEEGKGKTDV
ncbi:MAG: tetratricopeptide repeat protein [Verrucomicrobiaceae bacterium]|nr:tetratricopeptide repeat protein [Verrucomicrobiaceae bacterium]